jgi:hypothetical protein
MDWHVWEGYKICFKWHADVKLKNTNEDNSIEREEGGMSITMHAVNINRRAARRDMGICEHIKPKQESIAEKRGRTSQYKQLM